MSSNPSSPKGIQERNNEIGQLYKLICGETHIWTNHLPNELDANGATIINHHLL